MKTITNKKGNTGFQLTQWSTLGMSFSILDLVKHNNENPVDTIAYRIREVEVQSCGKKQMTVTNKGDFVKSFLDPETVLYATFEDAVEMAEIRFARAMKFAQSTAQSALDELKQEPTLHKFNPIGMEVHARNLKAMTAAKALLDDNKINLRLEVQ